MPSIIQSAGSLNLQFGSQENISFPLTLQYLSSLGNTTTINAASYTFSATVYQGGYTFPMAVDTTSAGSGKIVLSLGAGVLYPGKTYTWGLLATDALGNSRQLLTGTVSIVDVANPSVGGFILGNSYDNPKAL
jgi:hypothetical protein